MSAIAMQNDIVSSSKAAEVETTRPFLSVRDLHAYYGESYIVQGVSLDVRKGEILALLVVMARGKPRHCAPSPAPTIRRCGRARYGSTGKPFTA